MSEAAHELMQTNFEISLGSKLSMELAGFDEKLSTYLVGSAKGKFVITTMPVLFDKSELIFQFLYQDNRVTVRYLNSGAVQGFESGIIKYILSPFPLLFIGYPEKIESFNLRRFKRLACLFQAQAAIGGTDYQGIITDISLGGCSFLVRLNSKGEPRMDIDHSLLLKTPNFMGLPVNELECVVKRLTRNGDRMDLGLKFNNLSQESRLAIQEYINNALYLIS